MKIHSSGISIKEKIRRLNKPPLDKMLKQAKTDLVNESTLQGWKRFKKAIQTKKDSDLTGRIYVNDAVEASVGSAGLSAGNRISGATNKEIAGYLHFGRPEVRPVTAKVLRFYIGGKVIFSKVSKAVKANPWWGLSVDSKTRIRKIFKDFIKNGR